MGRCDQLSIEILQKPGTCSDSREQAPFSDTKLRSLISLENRVKSSYEQATAEKVQRIPRQPVRNKSEGRFFAPVSEAEL